MDAYGLLPADNFRVTTGHRADRSLLPQAAWYFRDETIAVPKPGLALAGFAPDLTLVRDLAAWTASNPPGAAPGYPPLVWLGSPQFIRDVALDPGGAKFSTTHDELALQLAERLALNGAWFDAASIAFFCGRPVKIRGIYRAETFVARTFWPQDFRLPALPASGILAAGPAAIRDRVRPQPQGGARSPFAVESLWRRPGAPAVQARQPLVGLMLNGAQGDDDEAHGGHFALMTGQVGSEGALDDLLVNNFYSLDSESPALDAHYLTSLGNFDIVYSWGVLHHTVEMWRALENAVIPTKPGGKLFIAIYNDTGSQARRWHWIKRTYCRLPRLLKTPFAVAVSVPDELKRLASALVRLKPSEYIHSWTRYKNGRGMNRWHDIIDWVGGYPYEVATVDEIFDFYKERGFSLTKVKSGGVGLGCNEFVFEKLYQTDDINLKTNLVYELLKHQYFEEGMSIYGQY